MSHGDLCKITDEQRAAGLRRLCAPEPLEAWTAEGFAKAEAEERRRLCRHEAAHAVVSLSLGRHVSYVSVMDFDAHVMERGRSDGPRWLHDQLFVTLAGDLGEAEPEPLDYADCRDRIALSRNGFLGTCDACKIAYYLAGLFGERHTDEDLALMWGHLRGTVVRLLAHPVIAESIDRLADHLGRRRLILADDLAVILNASALKAAAAELLAPPDLD